MAMLQNTDLVQRDAFGVPVVKQTTTTAPTGADPYATKTPIISGTLPKPPVAPTLATTATPASAPATSVLPPPPISATPVSTTPPAVTLPPVTPPPSGAPMQLSDTTLPPPVTLPSPPTAVGANVPGAAVAPFGPGNDLRYDSILPTAVDRLGLANQYFDQYAESTNPAYEQTLRAATQRAAANGILGSGMLTNTYGDVASQRAHELDLERRGFLTDALQGTIADNAANRDELRTERGYQSQTSQDAINQALQEALIEDQLGGNAFNRQLDLAQILSGFGYSGNPDDALLQASGQQAQSADATYQQIAALLQALGQRQAVG